MKISVIIPLYNSEKYIGDTIKSILSQSYSDFEIIIVDDGSTDNSKYQVKLFEEDNRIHYFYQKNQGAPSARNRGLIEANGDIITFFDADDLMEEGIFDIINKEFTYDKDLDLLMGGYIKINDTNEQISSTIFSQLNLEVSNLQESRNKFAYLDPLPGCKFYKKEFLNNNKMKFLDLKIGQDLNFYLNILSCNPKIKMVLDSFMYYRIHNSSISRTINNNFVDIIKSLDLVMWPIDRSSKEVIETLKYLHYTYHFYKIPFVKSFKDRIGLYDTFKKAYSKIDYSDVDFSIVNLHIRKLKLALSFKWLYISPFTKYIL